MKQLFSQIPCENSDPFVESSQKPSKFKEYLEHKVQTIQQTKFKTIKMTQKYFTQLKQKIDKYLAKQLKKILNAYEDNINMSINCVNHHFLYDFQTVLNKNDKIQRKISNEFTLTESDQKPRKKSYENQNQLTLKIQVKRLIEQMLLAETHLNQTVKLIGQELKSDVEKIILPLGDLFSKIPKLTQVSQNSSTLLVKEFGTNDKKKGKNSNKGKKIELSNIKNPEISSQKSIKVSKQFVQVDSKCQMTEKLFKKSNLQKQNLPQICIYSESKLLKLSQINEKEDKIATEINKNFTLKGLVTFDLINHKTLFYVYAKEKERDLLQRTPVNQPPQIKFCMILNQKPLLEDENTQLKYEKHCKIQFQSKPDRQYLAVLTSKEQTVQQGPNTRKLKNFRVTIFNYKGDMITKDLISNLKVNQTENSVSMFQIPTLRQYIFIVLFNRVKRYSLLNLQDQKSKLFSSQDCTITKVATNEDKILIFQGKNKVFHLMTHDLAILQTFKLQQIYLHMFNIRTIKNFKIPSENVQNGVKTTRQLSLIVPLLTVDAIYYLENGLIKIIQIRYVDRVAQKQDNEARLSFIQEIYEIYEGVYLISSRGKQWGKELTNVFILQVKQGQSDRLQGSVTYVDAIHETVVQSNMVKNRLYLTLQKGKTLVYSLC